MLPYPSEADIEAAILRCLADRLVLDNGTLFQAVSKDLDLTAEQIVRQGSGGRKARIWPQMFRQARRRLVQSGLLHCDQPGRSPITQLGLDAVMAPRRGMGVGMGISQIR